MFTLIYTMNGIIYTLLVVTFDRNDCVHYLNDSTSPLITPVKNKSSLSDVPTYFVTPCIPPKSKDLLQINHLLNTSQRLRGDSGFSDSFSTEQLSAVSKSSHDKSGIFPSSRIADKQCQYLSYSMDYSEIEYYDETKRSIVSRNIPSDSSMDDEQQMRNIQVEQNEGAINEHPELVE